jgi:hypothetical protein
VTTRSIIIALATVAALALGACVILQAPLVTGPSFWHWPYRRLPAWPLYGLLAAAGVPVFTAQLVCRSSARGATALGLACLALGCFAMKLASVLPYTDPPSLDLIQTIVENPHATSYYTDAAALRSEHAVREWLPLYPQYMSMLSLHSKTKPPGPILYWSAVIQLFGTGRTATLVGGIALGLFGSLSVVATYAFIRALTRLPDAAFAGASFMALCPGFVLFFPMFDPTYPILSCAIMGCWAGAVERRDRRLAILTGAALAVTCVVTFNVLVVGAFMAAYALVMPVDVSLRARVTRALTLGAVAVAVWLLLLEVLRLATGYDVYETFTSAWRNQHELLRRHAHTRPYPQTIPFDLLDFAFGGAWSGSVIAVGYFLDRAARADARLTRLSALCVAQLVLVALTGILQMETARVWAFMLPLLMVPAGLELRSWSPRARLCVFAASWFAMAAIAQNVKLIY